jgi:hypothetical protein
MGVPCTPNVPFGNRFGSSGPGRLILPREPLILANSPRAIVKLLGYYASILQPIAANQATVGMLLWAMQSISDAADRIAFREGHPQNAPAAVAPDLTLSVVPAMTEFRCVPCALSGRPGQCLQYKSIELGFRFDHLVPRTI